MHWRCSGWGAIARSWTRKRPREPRARPSSRRAYNGSLLWAWPFNEYPTQTWARIRVAYCASFEREPRWNGSWYCDAWSGSFGKSWSVSNLAFRTTRRRVQFAILLLIAGPRHWSWFGRSGSTDIGSFQDYTKLDVGFTDTGILPQSRSSGYTCELWQTWAALLAMHWDAGKWWKIDTWTLKR